MIKRTTYKRVKRVTLHRIIKPHQGTQKCTKEAETQHSTERCTYKNYETCKLHGEGDIRSTWHRDVRRSVEADRNGRLGQFLQGPLRVSDSLGRLTKLRCSRHDYSFSPWKGHQRKRRTGQSVGKTRREQASRCPLPGECRGQPCTNCPRSRM